MSNNVHTVPGTGLLNKFLVAFERNLAESIKKMVILISRPAGYSKHCFWEKILLFCWVLIFFLESLHDISSSITLTLLTYLFRHFKTLHDFRFDFCPKITAVIFPNLFNVRNLAVEVETRYKKLRLRRE